MSLFDSFVDAFNPSKLNTFLGNELGNITGQNKAFDYQKKLNSLTMQREDNAYQRAVADAKAAGLSPLSVTGGASANSMQSARIDNSSALGSALGFASQIASLKLEKQKADSIAEVNKAKAENLDANTALTNSKNDYQKVYNAWLEPRTQLELDKVSADVAYIKTKTWSEIREDKRAQDNIDSIIGLRASQRQNIDAQTNEIIDTVAHKIANMDASTALATANALLSTSRKSLIDIQSATDEEKLSWLREIMPKQLDMMDAQIKNLDYKNAGIVMQAVTSFIGAIVGVSTIK